MPRTSTPVTRVLAYGWLLLAVPAALAAGWGIKQLPTPDRGPEPAPTRPDSPVTRVSSSSPSPAPSPHRIEVTVTRDAGHGGPGMGARDAVDPPATEPPRPSEPAPRAELSQWTTIEDALAESQRNGKPVMIDFNADWCPPCRRMKEQVFQDGAHASEVQTLVIPVSIVDRSREDGRNPPEIEELQRRYQIDAFPTLIVFSPANGRIVKTKGFGDAQATVAWITEAARSVR
jgi:thiol-disulfide isomerase/thioredoxin